MDRPELVGDYLQQLPVQHPQLQVPRVLGYVPPLFRGKSLLLFAGVVPVPEANYTCLGHWDACIAADYELIGWCEGCPYEPRCFRSRYSADWSVVQREFDREQQGLSVPERVLHSNAQGKIRVMLFIDRTELALVGFQPRCYSLDLLCVPHSRA